MSKSLQETESFLAILKESKKQLEGEVVGMGASKLGASASSSSSGTPGSWLFSKQHSFTKPSLFSTPLVAHRRAKSLTTKVWRTECIA